MDDMIAWNADPAPPDGYPIVTYTWLILYREYRDQKKLAALRDFVAFGLTEGQKQAERLGYIPLPTPVARQVQDAFKNVKLVAMR
jgi:phosphate transport system substrate-binding protein